MSLLDWLKLGLLLAMMIGTLVSDFFVRRRQRQQAEDIATMRTFVVLRCLLSDESPEQRDARIAYLVNEAAKRAKGST